MGLCMHLYKRHLVENEYNATLDEKHSCSITSGDKRRDDIKSERIVYITEKVAEWYKAYAIHEWFINKVRSAAGYTRNYIEHEDLEELLKVVREVVKDNSKARELLPTYEGEDYDKLYFEDLTDTEGMLTQILSEPDEDSDYFYDYCC
jgi:hypothetical protein